MFEVFEKINIVCQPIVAILTITNTLLLTVLFIIRKSEENDKFEIQIRNKEICFFNKGKYTITIQKIDIKYIESEGVYAPFYSDERNIIESEIEIKGRNKKIIKFMPDWPELQNNKETLFLCFDINSDSGRKYDSLCCKILNRRKQQISRKRRLAKELWFVKK